jgi:hypothetical protein
VYKQCTNNYDDLGAILYEVKVKDQVGGSGITFSDQSEMTPINTAASVKSIQQLFAGREIKWTVNVQKDAFSRRLDELVYGTEYEPAIDSDGWVEMPLADRVGVQVPRYCVVIDYFQRGRNFAVDWVPAAEIMTEGGANMAAGVVYNKTMIIMAQTAAVPGYPEDTRAVRRYDSTFA